MICIFASEKLGIQRAGRLQVGEASWFAIDSYTVSDKTEQGGYEVLRRPWALGRDHVRDFGHTLQHTVQDTPILPGTGVLLWPIVPCLPTCILMH